MILGADLKLPLLAFGRHDQPEIYYLLENFNHVRFLRGKEGGFPHSAESSTSLSLLMATHHIKQ